MNKALLAKQGWRVYHDDKEWSTIWKHKYLFNAPSLYDFISYLNFLSPSIIWGVVQGAKNTLSKGCSQNIGNGLIVKFQEDACILDHPLIEDYEDWTQIDKCKQLYGNMVGHYQYNNSWVSLVDINHDFHNIQIMLNAFCLYPHKEDKMIWSADASGCFKVSSIFKSEEKFS